MDERNQQIQNSFDLDEFFGLQRGKVSYPSVFIEEDIKPDNKELPLILELLAEGNLPVTINYNGKLLEVKQAEKSMNTFYSLLKFYPLVVLVSENERQRISTLDELLELDINWS